jgi:hypothetical protein
VSNVHNDSVLSGGRTGSIVNGPRSGTYPEDKRVGDAPGRGVPHSRAIGWAIWLLTAIMSVALLVFVYRHGDNVPYFDDWLIVPAMTGHEPITPGWLWSQHNEHRMPVQKLLLLGLYRISGSDFRAGMYYSAAALILMACLLLRTAFKLRGRMVITDAFIPLLLLSLGHYNNLLWSVCAGYLTITLLAVLPICLIVSRPVPEQATALGMAILVCALPLTGAIGLAFAAPLAIWMLLSALALRKTAPGAAFDLGIGGILSVCLIGLYFVGYRGSGIPPAATMGSWLRASVDFLSLSMGPLGEVGQHYLGGVSVREVWGYAAGGILVLSAALNALGAVWNRREFVRKSGMALLILGSLLLALAIGWGRTHSSWPRYVTLGAPGLLAAYMSTLLSPGCRLGGALRGGLSIAAIVTAWPNAMAGLAGAEERHAKIASFEQEMRAGVPPLAEHFSRPPGAIHVRPRWQEFAADIRMLKAAGIGPFRDAAVDPTYQTIDIAPEPDSTAAELTYSPPDARHIYAVRVSYQCLPGPADAVFRLSWAPQGGSQEPLTRQYTCRLVKDGRKDHLFVWINEPVSQFRIVPDRGNEDCRISNVQLLIPSRPAGSR